MVGMFRLPENSIAPKDTYKNINKKVQRTPICRLHIVLWELSVILSNLFTGLWSTRI